MSTKISNEQIKFSLSEKEKEAESILKDNKAAEETLTRATTLLGKARKIPVLGGLVDDIATTIELIGNYVNGSYRKLPVKIIISAMAGIIYLVSPIDLIPDVVPFAGYLDDAAVITLILNTGLNFELRKYKRWKLENMKDTICYNIKNLIIASKGNDILVAVFLTDDDKMKLLLAEAPLTDERPIEVRPVVIRIPYDELKNVCNELKITVADALRDTTSEIREFYINGGQVEVCRESEFKDFDELFDILIEEE